MLNVKEPQQLLSFNSVDEHLPVTELRPSDDRRSDDSLFATVASGRIRDERSERGRRRGSEKRLPQGRCNYCTSRRLFEYVRTVGTNLDGTPNGETRQYSSSLHPCRTLTAELSRGRARASRSKRYTALKSTFSLLNFIGRRRRAAIPSYRATIVVFMMGIPMTAKCSAMQHDATQPDHPPNSFLPIDRDDFYDSQVADLPPCDHKAPDST